MSRTKLKDHTSGLQRVKQPIYWQEHNIYKHKPDKSVIPVYNQEREFRGYKKMPIVPTIPKEVSQETERAGRVNLYSDGTPIGGFFNTFTNLSSQNSEVAQIISALKRALPKGEQDALNVQQFILDRVKSRLGSGIGILPVNKFQELID
jgi:hypothetical protein